MLKANVLANLIGSGWIALLTLAVTPIQVARLGIEAYAVVAFIAVVQMAVSALDLGLSSTVTREVASDTSEDHQHSAPSVNSAGGLYWVMAIAISIALVLLAEPMAERFLRPKSLPLETVTLSVRIIAIYLALRWPIAFYGGVLTGMQRLTLLNLIKSGAATLRLGGGALLLLVWPTLTVFLYWFAALAALELLAFAVITHRLRRGLLIDPPFSFRGLRQIWRFSSLMGLMALLSVLLTQVDRIIIGGIQDLQALGLYSLAYSTSIGVTLVQLGINSAAMPALARCFGQGDLQGARNTYLLLSSGMAALAGLPTFALAFFSHDILKVWISEASADGAALSMSILSIGFFASAMASNAYSAAVAAGRPGIPLKVNLVLVLPYLMALYALVRWLGIVGAALAWVGLNLAYLATLAPSVHRQILSMSLWSWLGRQVLPFAALGVVSFGAFKGISWLVGGELVTLICFLLACLVYCLGGFFLLPEEMRRGVAGLLRARAPMLRGR